MTEWWTMQDGNWYGAIGGSAIGVIGGCYGGLVGWLAPRGIGRRFFLTLHAVLIVLGVVALVAGIAALSVQQPYHVWYPLVLVGGILTLVMGCLFPVILTRYRQAEHRRLGAEELRRG
ncbi:MAG: hypothetical protein IT437_07670 [Phycisphaerales bacterium]|nr:hypothetical protein [Phycisphaerales bacterium]